MQTEASELTVAAYIAATGTHVERHLVLTRVADLTEEVGDIDVLGTRFGTAIERTVVEVKSGDARTSDVFKLAGQALFFGSSRAFLVVPPDARASLEPVAQRVGVTIVRCQDSDCLADRFPDIGLGHASALDIEAFARAFLLQDVLLAKIENKGVRKEYPTVDVAWQGYRDIHVPTWLEPNLVERASGAYQSFWNLPRSSRAHAEELAGSETQTDQVFKEALYQGERPTIQALLLLEWITRPEIAKLAVEAAFAARPRRISYYTSLPEAFRVAVQSLEGEPAIMPVWPALLQWFVLVRGGFYLEADGSVEDRDLAAIGRQFGLSSAQTIQALGMLNKLFPLGEGNWFSATGSWKPVRLLKLVPFAVQGLGVLHRDATDPGWRDGLSEWVLARFEERAAAARRLLNGVTPASTGSGD